MTALTIIALVVGFLFLLALFALIALMVDFNRRTFALSNSAAGHPPGYRTETGDTPDPGAPPAFGPSGPGAFAMQQRGKREQ